MSVPSHEANKEPNDNEDIHANTIADANRHGLEKIHAFFHHHGDE